MKGIYYHKPEGFHVPLGRLEPYHILPVAPVPLDKYREGRILLEDRMVVDLAGILVDHCQDKPRAGRRRSGEDSD